MVVQDVTAYGVVVDWLHDHIYWSADSSITVGSLDGRTRMVLLSNLDAPAQLAIDPINRLDCSFFKRRQAKTFICLSTIAEVNDKRVILELIT